MVKNQNKLAKRTIYTAFYQSMDQISLAIEARDTLVNQRQTFKAIQTKLNDITNRFPLINNLVQKINLRKRRDAVIVALVIGLCLTFLLWWMIA